MEWRDEPAKEGPTEGLRHYLFPLALALAALVMLLLSPTSALAERGAVPPELVQAIQSKGLNWTPRDYDRDFALGALLLEEPILPNAEGETEADLSQPAALDWRNNGGDYVSPIKDQGSCGSCWAFASVAGLESWIAIDKRTPGSFLDLSEQLLVSCESHSSGCNGGYMYWASVFLRDQGVPAESCFPYCACDAPCSDACANWRSITRRINGFVRVSQSVDALRNALLTGPVVTVFAVYSDFFYYGGGVYEYAWGQFEGYHAVLIVGYVNTPGQYGGGYFIVKNSWGNWWGEQGFFRIGYSQVTSWWVRFGVESYLYGCRTPETPSLAAPANGSATSDNTPTFSWAAASNANEYRLQVDNNADFSSPEVNAITASTSYTPSMGLTGGTYYWRVRGHNTSLGCNVWGPWSGACSVVVLSFSSPARWVAAYGTNAGGWTSQDLYPRHLADVNGDGRADVVGFYKDGVFVSRSSGTGFLAPARWIAKFGTATSPAWSSQNTYPRVLGDVNKDGRADIVGFYSDGVYVSLSTGTGFAAPVRWLAKFGTATSPAWSSQNTYPRMLGDVNQDGRADIVGFYQDGVYVSLSTGTSFGAPARWVAAYGTNAGGWASQDKFPRMVADVNGDGRADVVGFASSGAYVSLSTGGAFASPARWIAAFGTNAGGWTSQDTYPRMLGDVNKDGRADIIGFCSDGAYVSLSTGTKFAAAVLGINRFGTVAGGWASQDKFPRWVGDASGDGKADIVGFASSGVSVSRSLYP